MSDCIISPEIGHSQGTHHLQKLFNDYISINDSILEKIEQVRILQLENVFVDLGYFKNEMLDISYLRWLYTAITRATKKLYLINFKNDFF